MPWCRPEPSPQCPGISGKSRDIFSQSERDTLGCGAGHNNQLELAAGLRGWDTTLSHDVMLLKGRSLNCTTSDITHTAHASTAYALQHRSPEWQPLIGWHVCVWHAKLVPLLAAVRIRAPGRTVATPPYVYMYQAERNEHICNYILA